jgi:tetratricopeptide (TPR) repeat protein
MKRLVVLKLDGDLEEQGFRVSLEIGAEGDRPTIELMGYLPRSPEILTCLKSHWEKYRQIEEPFRIKPQRIIYSGSIEQRVAECQQSAQNLRQLLNSWLDSEGFRPLDQRLREELSREDTIRVLIRTDNQHLHKLPWHLWNLIESYPLAEVALSPRESEPPRRTVTKSAKSKLRILAILGHSANIDVESDRKLLENLPQTETVFLVEPQHRQINDQLWEQSWDIIFFAGHSETQGDKGRIYINPTESLTVTELWYGLRKAVENGLKLAIFNSCDGLGLARQLDDLQIPQIIVMRELIPDRVAQEFLKYFLDDLSKNRPFYLAVRAARERLQGWESKFPCASWLPVIYQNPSEEPFTWPELDRGKKPKIWVLKNKVAVASVLITLGVGGWQLVAPQMAIWINNIGLKNYFEGKVTEARSLFELALIFNPNNGAALYNLAWICEDAKDFQCAKEKYSKAVKNGYAAAYSNLGRFYITLESNYDYGADLSQLGLKYAQDDRIKYALMKNLGWARLGQGRYQEAKEQLQEAIQLIGDRAPAHCLLAQVLEVQKEPVAAQKEWQSCLQFGRNDRSDEDRWMGIARQRLQPKDITIATKR